MIVEKAYAKINLALEVKEKREDGYHEVSNLMIPINLYDELTFEKSDELLLISDMDIEDNFIIKAANIFFDTYKIEGKAKITLKKKIPIAAGLAGGSSDASACLRGLNRLYNLNISLDELSKLSAKLGSDMPYCIYQKLALCTGRGEIVNLIDIDYKKYDCMIIKPSFGLSTKEVYSNYKYVKANNDNKIKSILEALEQDDIDKLNDNIFNDLETPAMMISSELLDLKKGIIDLGYDVKLSGSGPTLFILGEKSNFEKIVEKIEKKCYYDITNLK